MLSEDQQREGLKFRKRSWRNRPDEGESSKALEKNAVDKARSIAAEQFGLFLSPDDPLARLVATNEIVFQQFEEGQKKAMTTFRSQLEEAILKSRKEAESEAIDLVNVLMRRLSNEMTAGSTEAIKAVQQSLWAATNAYVTSIQENERLMAGHVADVQAENKALRHRLAAAASCSVFAGAAAAVCAAVVVLEKLV